MSLQEEEILVTGGHGFLGRALLRKLRERGVPEERIFAPSSRERDLRVFTDCEDAVRNRSVVIHLAGVTGGIEFHLRHPGRIFYDNAAMAVNLMEAARRAGVKKFLGIGSAAAYPTDAPLPYREESLWSGGERDAAHAAYNAAKLALLAQGQAYRSEYGFKAVHLILTNLYGPGARVKDGNVIPQLIRRVMEAEAIGAPLEVWGTGRATRDFLYVDDAAEGIIAAAERYDGTEPVNLGSGQEVSVREIAETICRLVGFGRGIRWLTDKPEGPLRRRLDISRAEREFGFQPATPLESGLRETIAWYRALHEPRRASAPSPASHENPHRHSDL